jgi:hypothetical protein
MSSTEKLPVVFTAQSKVFFYCRDAVCEFVFQRSAIPLNPFRVFEYFLGDRVDRNLVRQANNNLIRIVDELWVFGESVADGVLFEIEFARELGKPIRYFTIDNRADKIREILPTQLRFERKVYASTGLDRDGLLRRVLGYPVDEPPPEQLALVLANEGDETDGARASGPDRSRNVRTSAKSLKTGRSSRRR